MTYLHGVSTYMVDRVSKFRPHVRLGNLGHLASLGLPAVELPVEVPRSAGSAGRSASQARRVPCHAQGGHKEDPVVAQAQGPPFST